MAWCHTSSQARKRSKESRWIFSWEIRKIIIGWCNSLLNNSEVNRNSNSNYHRNFRIKVISNHINNNNKKINKLTTASKICSQTSIKTLKFSHFCASAEPGSIMTKRYSSMLTLAHKCSTPMECSSNLLCSWSIKLDKLGRQLRAPSWGWTYWRSLDHSQLILSSISTSAKSGPHNQGHFSNQ